MSARDDALRARVRIELEEVVTLLCAAREIADGLVGLLEHAYDHDHRVKDALAAAITAANAIDNERLAAEQRNGTGPGRRA